ncbi:MAG: Rnase Y domain-containing protein, partial [Oscillospiraceae bacterium]
MWIVYILIGLAVGSVIMFPLGIQYRKKISEKEISSAEEEAKRIINEAIKSSESKKREALVEAKEEILRTRSEYEKEVKERRADLQRQENRLQQKEENLDRKTENIEKKEDALQEKQDALEAQRDEVVQLKKTEMDVLERISGLTADEAKKYLIDQLEVEVTHEQALKIKEIETRFKDEADTNAR